MRKTMSALLAVALVLALSSPARAKIWPMAQEYFTDDLRNPRIVRMEVVRLATPVVEPSQRDRFVFDDYVVNNLYAKQPNKNCVLELYRTNRDEILSEFNKYKPNFTKEKTDIEWRILMMNAENRVLSRVYIGKIFIDRPDVVMVVDGQMMVVDRRFAEFLNGNARLNRCRI